MTLQTCIWCGSDSNKSDVSHVLPECFGNESQQILPVGTVCASCNNYFGTKIEPHLIEDPALHAIFVASRIVDPGDANVFRDRMFDAQHEPDDAVDKSLIVNARIVGNSVRFEIQYSIQGTITKHFDHRWQSKFSRAIHKISFESYVWHWLRGDVPHDAPNPYLSIFNEVKQWSRFGQPHGKIRPYVRMPTDQFENSWEFRSTMYSFGLMSDMRIYSDCFAVSLTSTHGKAISDLRSCCKPRARAVLISDRFEIIDPA